MKRCKMNIQLQNIEYKVKGKEIISHFSADFQNGNVYCLFGKNGSGKTTLLNILALLRKMQSGNFYFNGDKLDDYRRKKDYKDKISFFSSSQEILFKELTVKQNIWFYLNINKICIDKSKIDEIGIFMKRFSIGDLVNIQIKKLSKGQKQKVALTIILLLDKPIVLLDEPYDGLDITGYSALNEYINRWKESKIIVIASPIQIEENGMILIQVE